jgi:hypothetical protein
VTEPEAQERLLRIVSDVEGIRSRLLEVHQDLPVPPDEDLMLVGEAEMDVATEVRSVIECVLNDNIEPAIRDLSAAAEYKVTAQVEASR